MLNNLAMAVIILVLLQVEKQHKKAHGMVAAKYWVMCCMVKIFGYELLIPKTKPCVVYTTELKFANIRIMKNAQI